MSRATFPTYTAISKVNVAEILQRMDVLVLLSLIISSYFKIGTFYFAATYSYTSLFSSAVSGRHSVAAAHYLENQI